jgi:hypothetical protein
VNLYPGLMFLLDGRVALCVAAWHQDRFTPDDSECNVAKALVGFELKTLVKMMESERSSAARRTWSEPRVIFLPGCIHWAELNDHKADAYTAVDIQPLPPPDRVAALQERLS